MSSRILIIDYGSQYTQLIARRVREARVYSEIHPPTRTVEWVRQWKPTGIILSGGPSSVYGENVPTAHRDLLDVAPILGVCYGMQLIAHLEGGAVERPPDGYIGTAKSADSPIAGMRHRTKPIHAVQFHPEVAHTPRGGEIISNFLFEICKAEPSWTPGAFIDDEIRKIRQLVGDKRVICGLSGGVDSSVAAALVHRAIGDQLTCVFVDTGLLRMGEREQVERTFRAHLGVKLVTIDASKRFLDALAGIEEPEKKRRAIGHTFIDVFEDATA